MIVVEGLDNTGKTMLCEQLQVDFPELSHRPSIGNKHDLQQIHYQALSALDDDARDPLILWDRSRFISEFVYNPVLKNRPTAYTMVEWLNMLANFVARPQLIIYCFRTPDRLLKDFDEREQLPGVLEHVPELVEAYDQVWSMLHCLFTISEQDSRIYLYSFDHENKEFKYPKIRTAVADYIERVSHGPRQVTG